MITEEMTLEQVEERIRLLEQSVHDIKNSPVPAAAKTKIAECEKDEQRILDEFKRAVEQVRKVHQEMLDKLKEYESQASMYDRELEELRRLLGDKLALKAAQDKLDAIKKELEELRTRFPWSESIMPFQWDDAVFALHAYKQGKNGVLNANDMGLGKTFWAGAMIDMLTHLFYAEHGRLPHILWLTKKSLTKTTQNELKKWNPDRKVAVLDPQKPADMRETFVEFAYQMHSTLISNYDALNTVKNLMAFSWDIIIMDEVHKVKGGAQHKPTLIFTNTKAVCERARFVMPLSGSPIQNHPKEMWCYLNIFDPARFPDARRFMREFCFGYDEGMRVNWDHLIRTALSGRVIRRSKSEVLKDLPEKTKELRYVDLEGQQAVIYNTLRDNFFIWLDEQHEKAMNVTTILAQLTRLRQAALMPGSIKLKDDKGAEYQVECNESAKLDEAMEIIEELRGQDDQVVVFSSQFNAPLFELGRRITEMNLGTWETMTGDNSSQMLEIQDRFQQGKTQILLVNSKSGGEGLNLQKSEQWPGGANHVIFLDLWWNPKFNEQCEDRVHRQGQRDAVTIHVIQAENSVDNFIMGKLEEKESMIEGIMEREELRTGGEWTAVLKELL